MILLDVVIGLGSFLIKSVMHRSAERDKLLARHREYDIEDKQNARQFNTSEAYSARRFAFSFATIVLFGMPVIAPLFGFPVAVSFLMWDPGFLWFEGTNEIVWKEFGDPNTAKVVIHAPLYNFYSMMCGFYFGTERRN